ncbi:MAG: ATP-binding protein, partial [Actinomycetota bacterium]|nr:ATP-binding protein [Actinomycetota bacterium]
MSVLETGELQIGDIGKAIFHLGNVYEDPRDALAEFVTNSIDARAKHVLVRLHRRGQTGSIEIEDDGEGMSRSDLRRVASSLCDSIKADDERTVGEKGIGILGFQELAANCEIVSRNLADPATHSLRVRKGSREYTISAVPKQSLIPGTRVRLGGIDKNR